VCSPSGATSSTYSEPWMAMVQMTAESPWTRSGGRRASPELGGPGVAHLQQAVGTSTSGPSPWSHRRPAQTVFRSRVAETRIPMLACHAAEPPLACGRRVGEDPPTNPVIAPRVIEEPHTPKRPCFGEASPESASIVELAVSDRGAMTSPSWSATPRGADGLELWRAQWVRLASGFSPRGDLTHGLATIRNHLWRGVPGGDG